MSEDRFQGVMFGTAAILAAIGVLAAGVLCGVQLYGAGTDPLILVALAWVGSGVLWVPAGALAGLLVWLPVGAGMATRHYFIEARRG